MAKKIYLTVQELATACGGQLLAGSAEARLDKFSTDTRTLKAGALFFALVGPNYDAHQFLKKALESKAAGAVISKETAWVKIKKNQAADNPLIILVPDTEKALGAAARLWREKHPVPLAAVTGSNGKTTTKEMLAHILKQKFALHVSSGNFNNLVGVPLTLFDLNRRHQAVVLELGMNAPGEIAQLAEIARPQVGIITNISGVHLEFLKDVEGVARAKGELFDYLNRRPEAGTVVLNADDPYLQKMAAKARCQVLTFGFSFGSDFQALEAKSGNHTDGGAHTTFTLKNNNERAQCRLPLPGRHNIYNALAAVGAASCFVVSLKEAAAALENFSPPPLRSRISRLASGVTVYNDCYNANPRSMETAVRTLMEISGRDPKVLVLGDMLEMGPQSPALHRGLGAMLGNLPVNLLVAVGPMSLNIIQGALEAGLEADKALHFDHSEAAAAALRTRVIPGSWVLVKGSRGMKMEKVVEGLK